MYTSTKTFYNYPCAHRNWKHDGACSYIHGYSRSFHFIFGCNELTKEGFVVDFGKLKFIKEYLYAMYDHTLLVEPDDPLIPMFEELEKHGAVELKTPMYGVGMEGTAKLVCEASDQWLTKETEGRAWVVSVEARENDKNSAIYLNPMKNPAKR